MCGMWIWVDRKVPLSGDICVFGRNRFGIHIFSGIREDSGPEKPLSFTV